MADILLRAWNAPEVVTNVVLDAARMKSMKEINSTVSDINFQPDSLHWTQSDKALPLPFDPRNQNTAGAATLCPDIIALDQEMLTVLSLKAGNYQLTIDGEVIGEYTSDRLAAGINLALVNTPMLRQSLLVARLADQQNLTRDMALNAAVRLKGTSPALRSLLDAYKAINGDIVSAEHAQAQPVPHTYLLQRK
jgi:hypothetical protein